jgi:hypothetical protein
LLAIGGNHSVQFGIGLVQSLNVCGDLYVHFFLRRQEFTQLRFAKRGRVSVCISGQWPLLQRVLGCARGSRKWFQPFELVAEAVSAAGGVLGVENILASANRHIRVNGSAARQESLPGWALQELQQVRPVDLSPLGRNIGRRLRNWKVSGMQNP